MKLVNFLQAEENKENDQKIQVNPKKQVYFKEAPSEVSKERRILCDQQQNGSVQKEEDRQMYDLEEKIPPDLERYIRVSLFLFYYFCMVRQIRHAAPRY